MEQDKILTIAIPTYNRAEYLAGLLRSIAAQIDTVRESLDVIIVDNASTDDTAKVCAELKGAIPSLRYVRNQINVGPKLNVVRCAELTTTPYCWMMGDDEVIRYGSLIALVALIRTKKPNMVCMRHLGIGDKPDPTLLALDEAITPLHVSRREFTKLVHIYTTMLSVTVFNREVAFQGRTQEVLYRFSETSFPQLSWVLALLSTGERLYYIPQYAILARGGASGGYNLYRVFSIELGRIVYSALDKRTGDMMMRRVIWNYLPRLIVSARAGGAGSFNVSSSQDECFREALGDKLGYWLFILPSLRWWLPVANVWSLCVRAWGKAVYAIDAVLVNWRQPRQTKSTECR